MYSFPGEDALKENAGWRSWNAMFNLALVFTDKPDVKQVTVRYTSKNQ